MNGAYGYPPTPIPRGGSLFSRIFPGNGLRSINWSNMLNNTQKTLNIINQAIPIAYQIKPMVNNAKTMFKIIGAVKDDNTELNTRNTELKQTENKENQPIFYL